MSFIKDYFNKAINNVKDYFYFNKRINKMLDDSESLALSIQMNNIQKQFQFESEIDEAILDDKRHKLEKELKKYI